MWAFAVNTSKCLLRDKNVEIIDKGQFTNDYVKGTGSLT